MKYSSVGCFLFGSFLLRALELGGVVSSSLLPPCFCGWLVGMEVVFWFGIVGVFWYVFSGIPTFKPVFRFRIKIELCAGYEQEMSRIIKQQWKGVAFSNVLFSSS